MINNPKNVPSTGSATGSQGATLTEFVRRTMHGGVGWAAPAQPGHALYQPQDGAPASRGGAIAEIFARRRKPVAGEPEDARLTGGTRSLFRRMSGLNFRGLTKAPVAAVEARLLTANVA